MISEEQEKEETGICFSLFKHPLHHLFHHQAKVLVFSISSFPIQFSQSIRKMSRPGDWNCRSCQYMNFQRRESCQRCGDSKMGSEFAGFGGRGGTSFGFIGSDVRPGDWYCNIGNCGAHNFASRSNCFKCGAFKDECSVGGFDFDVPRARPFSFGNGIGNGGRGVSAWKSGDWICSRLGCKEHNFASRMECFKCNAPRDSF